jgi:hypothetical protein
MCPTLCLLIVASASPGVGPPPKNELPARVLAVLEKADSVELYSLNGPAQEKGDSFQGWKVLGKTVIKDEKVRTALLDQVRTSLPRSPGWTKVRLLNWSPWYGLRVKRGDQSVDLLLNCRWGWLTAHTGKERVGKYAITDKAKGALDRLLKEAKVPVARGRVEEDRPSILTTILEKADSVELYSLEPLAEKDDKGPRLHGYKVLGKIAIKDAKTRKDLVGRITPAIVPDVYTPLMRAFCFRPRHAFRMRYEGETIDVLICFECHNINLHWGGDKKQLMKLAKQEGWTRIYFSFALDGREAQPALDEFLRKAKVPLAKKQD